MTPTAVMLSPKFYIEPEDTKGKRVLLRVDFNISIKDSKVQSDFRIKRVLPTIKKLTNSGAKVILIAHIDDKEGGSLEPVARYLLEHFPRLYFVKDIFDTDAKSHVDTMREGDVILFENLRKWEGEKANDIDFAKHLSTFADIYVNEAFSVSHRPHASIVGVTEFLPSYFGYAFKEEIEHLSQVFDPSRPFLAVMGGAKFETKVPLVSKFLDLADLVLVGGAIANDFIKAKGYFVGESLTSEKEPEGIRELLEHNKLIIPIDVYTMYKGERSLKHLSEISVGEKILDVGDRTLKMLKVAVMDSEFVLWNGPLGKVESGFGGSTETFAKILAESEATTIVGGGDVVSTIESLGVMDKFTFVSSGGGAMLDFLADETLVGIESLISVKKKQKFATTLSQTFEKMAEEPKIIAKSLLQKIKDIF